MIKSITTSILAAMSVGMVAAAAPAGLTDANMSLGEARNVAKYRTAGQVKAPAVMTASEEAPTVITSVPSTATKAVFEREWHGFWVWNYFYSVIMTGEDYGRVQDIYFDGDDVYLKTPVQEFDVPSYIKGKKTEKGLVFPMPQCIYSYNDTQDGEMVRTDYYVQMLYCSPEFSQIYYTGDGPEEEDYVLALQPDGTYKFIYDHVLEHPVTDANGNPVLGDDGKQKIDRYADRILGVVNQDEIWSGYGNYEVDLKLFDTPLAVPPTFDSTTLMTLTSGKESRKVNVGFAGNEVWVKGFVKTNPESWVKGVTTDGVTRFGQQYVGIDNDGEYFGFFSGCTSTVEYDDVFEQDVRTITPLEYAEFTYDPATYTFTPKSDVFVGGQNFCYEIEYIEKPKLEGQEDSMIPHEVEINSFSEYNPDFGYAMVNFTIPAISVTGAKLDTSKLSYRILIDNEPYTFLANKHSHMATDLEWIPFDYSDGGYDIRIEGTEGLVRNVKVRKYVDQILGVELRYEDNEGEYLDSKISEAYTERYVPPYVPPVPEITPSTDDAQYELRVIEIKFPGGVVELVDGCQVDIDNGVNGNSQLNPRFDYEGCTYKPIFCNQLYEVRNGDTLYLERFAAIPNGNYAEGSPWITLELYGGSYTVDGNHYDDMTFTYVIDPTLKPEDAVKSLFGESVNSYEVFDLMGRRVMHNASAGELNTLKGAYIVNGKKIIF